MRSFRYLLLISSLGLSACASSQPATPDRSAVIEAIKHTPDVRPVEVPLYKREYQSPGAYPVPDLVPYAGPKKPIKNIILMIGDGMGPAQVTGGLLANRGRLFMQQAQTTGLSITQNQYGKITDSAASATAMATGHKTRNAAIGMDSLGHEFRSIMWDAREHGKSTGVVVACELTDATPACFAVTHPDRNDQEAIALKYLAAPIDFMYAGGLRAFTQRQDHADLLPQWRQKGYQVVTKPGEVASITGPKAIALLAENGPPAVAERTAAYINQGVDKALEVLSKNKNGFFLMIEGSQIDDAGHFNNATQNVQEVLDFDQQVGKAFRFAAANGETLVIVTADHETGGYSIMGGSAPSGKIAANFATNKHSAVMVPVFAYGVGSELFTGMYENTEIYYRIKKALNWNSADNN
ncbi:alkaline phosphatase [Hymenobacter sp. BT507]|uniref:Alkaline phosphatase n=1 Tax=Hymenobacter citatus TaxID=2763506 RepID=A0ABR7MJW4_9BACT|nr:alkaline phosphatase [Hymenobacter citatus]MBC6611355.1 alkaline phosphatase [Hymenobacter citatus]